MNYVSQTFGPGVLVDPSELRQYLKCVGQNVKVFRGCRIDHPELLEMGDASQIDEGVFLFAGEGIKLGRHVHLAFGSSISGGGRCEIHDYAGIGAGVRLITGTENISEGLTNPTVPHESRHVKRGQIVIHSHALVFTNSVVFPNVTIGEGAVVSAGSVVHHDLKPWTIYGGHPLVAIQRRKSR